MVALVCVTIDPAFLLEINEDSRRVILELSRCNTNFIIIHMLLMVLIHILDFVAGGMVQSVSVSVSTQSLRKRELRSKHE